MNYCPQCGKPLPLQDLKFCPECGCNLLSQKAKDYDVICPDCNSIISDENSDCPICGCPSNLFTKRPKETINFGATLECPDCGAIFMEKIPSTCPNCGCPSNYFVQKKKSDRSATSISNKNFSIKTLIIIISICLAGGIGYYIISTIQEKAAHEQYVKEQNERRKSEEANAKRLEQEKERFLNKISGTYYSKYFNYRGRSVKYRIYLRTNKRYTIDILDYYSQVLHSESGYFDVVPKDNGIVLNPNSSNSSWIKVVGRSLEWGDIDLY